MFDDGIPPPERIDALWFIRSSLGNIERRVSRAGFDGTLDPHWAHRIREALGAALSLCDRARAAGAVLPVSSPSVGSSIEVHGTLQTEPQHAQDDASWLGRS